jgi:hypothetical protein
VDWQRPSHSPVPLSVIGKGGIVFVNARTQNPTWQAMFMTASMVIVSVGRWAVRQASYITLGSRPVAELPACGGQSV